MPFLMINHQPLPFLLRRSDRAKRLQLKVAARWVEIVAPNAIRAQEALRYLYTEKKWLAKIQKKIFYAKNYRSQSWWPEESVMYQGQSLRLHFKYDVRQASCFLQDKTLIVQHSLYQKIDEIVSITRIQVEQWYQQQAAQLIKNYVEKYAPIIKRWPTQVLLKRQKSRWGSCGINNHIYINWLLVLAPPNVLEYVVVHELCHLIHRNHGARFWNKVAYCFPSYQQSEQWLRENGSVLQGWG